MRTDDLIRGLAADEKRETSPGRAVALLLPAGLAVAVLLFSLLLRVRPDFLPMLATPWLPFKFAVTLSLAVAALLIVSRLVRPGVRAGPVAVSLLVPCGMLALGIAAVLGLTPPETWGPGLVGHYARYCVVFVPLMGAPILAALLLALRKGAPTRPGLAGACAGLAAGGLGAALYAFHCTDDSPLFVLTWYGIGIAALTAAGALIGRRVLAW
ncbi:MAG TPA: NrsF family protein [Kaistia sp.]|nr:NrsF family protein [Kaistia sp.]